MTNETRKYTRYLKGLERDMDSFLHKPNEGARVGSYDGSISHGRRSRGEQSHGSRSARSAEHQEDAPDAKTPGREELIRRVLDVGSGANSDIHGPEHWKRVAIVGSRLIEDVPAADSEVVFLFALFHDSMRQSDGHDPSHGKRGGELARRMRDTGKFELEEERLLTLEEACTYHDKGRTSTDPTTGICWDADRLNLWRVGVRPDPRLLCMEASKEAQMLEFSRDFQDLRVSWEEVCRGFGLRAEKGAE